MNKMRLFVPIRKVDEEQRLVYGLATEEVVDKSDEIMDYATSKPLFEKWSGDISKATSGKSLGNLREMHQPSAVGKLTDIQFDDATMQIPICVKVVDENAWQKVLEGVYTGFSMGGSYVKRWDDPDRPGVKRFTANPCEISLVDNPCVPTAHFQVIKADGATEERMFKMYEPTNEEVAARASTLAKAAGNEAGWAGFIEAAIVELKAEHAGKLAVVEEPVVEQTEPEPEPEPVVEEPAADKAALPTPAEPSAGLVQVWKTTDGQTFKLKKDALAHRDLLLVDGDSPVAVALAAAKAALAASTDDVGEAESIAKGLDEIVAKYSSVPELAKGLRGIASLAQAIYQVVGVQSSATREATTEGDNSAVPGQIMEGIRTLTDALVAMAVEETGELMAEIEGAGMVVDAYGGSCYFADKVTDLAKAAPDFSERVEAIKKSLEAPVVVEDEVTDPEALAKIAPTLVAENEKLTKQVGEAVTGIQELTKSFEERFATMTAEMAALKKSPTPMAPKTNPIGRGTDEPAEVASAAKTLGDLFEKAKGGDTSAQSVLADMAIRLAQENGHRVG